MIRDFTDRYHIGKFQQTDVDWRLNRNIDPVEAIIIHHTAGWYGGLGAGQMTPRLEEIQLDALAADHRNRFGIGPGYHYAVFPSGNVYAIGKSGTHRAHTKGRNPEGHGLWNRRGIGIVAFGNYEENRPTSAMIKGIREAVNDVKRWSKNLELPIYWHRDVPTVSRNGTVYTQSTACPGQFLIEALIAAQGQAPEPEPVIAWIENVRDGLEKLEDDVIGLRGQLYAWLGAIRTLRDLLPDKEE
jgi:hypothetical protein